MKRSSESHAQRPSRRGVASNAASGLPESNDDSLNTNEREDERDQDARQEERGRPRHSRRSSGKYKNDASAASQRAPNHGRGIDAANDVLGTFYNMLLQVAPPQQGGIGGNGEEGSIQIDPQKASNVLEATAGNLEMAANLYWDDYFASQAANQFEAAANANDPADTNARNPIVNARADRSLDQKPAADVVERDGALRRFPVQYRDVPSEHHNNEMVGNHRQRESRNSPETKKRRIELAVDNPSPSKRRLRRSLDSDFQAADDDDETKKKKREAKLARRSNEHDGKTEPGDNAQDKDDEAKGDDLKMPAGFRMGLEDALLISGDQPPIKRRVHRSLSIRQQDLPKYVDDNGKKREAQESRGGSDDKNDEDAGDNKNERLRRHRGRRQRRGEPRRVAAQDGIETTISVSDDELGRVNSKTSKRITESSRQRGNLDRKDDPSDSASSKHDSHAANRSAVMKAMNAIHRKINPNSTNLSKTSTWFLSPKEKNGKRCPGDNDDESMDSSIEDYISDDDWLRSESCSIPFKHLWGNSSDLDHSSLPGIAGGIVNKNNEGSNGNVVVDEDAMNVSGEEEDGYDNNLSSISSTSAAVGGSAFAGIPYLWLNAGFQLSDCGSGLVVKSPSVEDIEFFSWRQSQVNDKRNAIPPPYHCKALTAITSIVTGLLYTGASIQGNEVNFTSGKTPWSSINVDERKREFESRLADALSSLIFIAAQVSLKRKKKAYREVVRHLKCRNVENNYSTLLREVIAERKGTFDAIRKKNDENNVDDNIGRQRNDMYDEKNSTSISSAVVEDNIPKHDDQNSRNKSIPTTEEKKELMRRRLDLIPVCIWADKKKALAPRAGDGPPVNPDVTIKTTWTNIRDIELYVKSNLRAFTEKGGIALFLETLLRIHGHNVIARQLNRCASMKALGERFLQKENIIPDTEDVVEGTSKIKLGGCPSLIRCTCEDRQKKIHEEKPLPLNIRTDPSKLLDTTPSGTECASVELLTLILTGRINSNWKNCSSEKLGIGLLTDNIEDLSHSLARPEKPVWLVKGETCYSVLIIVGSWSSADDNGGSQSECSNKMAFARDLKTISKVDKPGVSLNLCHWNAWYGQRQKTEMRLVASKLGEDVPSKKLLSKFAEKDGITNISSLLMQRRRHESTINSISIEEQKVNEAKQKEAPITRSELEYIEIHSDDQRLYPKNHKMWRFNFNKRQVIEPAVDTKQSAENWIPYFLLTSHQKRLVEMKLGPAINIILRTRWPGAIIDNFKPIEGGFPVV
mmetsp:Transcript_24815/g.58219  ORF Transcript_24815/g.58219 Transcript_24815/m.58219 type:complete len:1258 (+) Transcript_24815:48-3821(+)|eukprot:CAMPEP_0197195384 /NCGR_PEP_ID=MMETSP1423-20130617/30988_1 /TAXON_ID=476441 /ORGANISM="Pseudo-nitzschia heimii, Strain UNC1101" /LENGTH=1257 /DNA_ID=CAMNT_0042649011 /DNA_START=30 /DNA_END=3803 /DNA_ORIENTATION=-